MDPKNWWQSKTIWGSIIGGAAVIVSLVFHRTISPADQSAIVDVIMTIVGAAGSAFAIYGRVTTTTTIGTPTS